MRDENYHPIPAVRRAREKFSGMKPGEPAPEHGKPEHGKHHGKPHKAEHFRPESPENTSPGKHHTVLHHADGQEEHMDHASADDAMNHIQQAMGDQQEPDADDMGGPPDNDEDDTGY